MLKSNGPKIDPRSTPCSILDHLLKLFNFSALCAITQIRENNFSWH